MYTLQMKERMLGTQRTNVLRQCFDSLAGIVNIMILCTLESNQVRRNTSAALPRAVYP